MRQSAYTMANALEAWKVLPHGPLEELAENLWWTWGSVPGMSLKRAMTVARLEDGRLVIHNAIALEEPEMAKLEALGTPAFLVVPSGIHRLDAKRFRARYPSISVVTPRGAKTKVEEVVPVDTTYREVDVGDPSVRFEPFASLANAEGAMIVRSADGLSLVLNDVVFNMDRKRDLFGFLFTTILGSAPGPRISRLVKLALVKDRAALRHELERLAALPELTRLIVAHEKVAHGPDARAALHRAVTYL